MTTRFRATQHIFRKTSASFSNKIFDDNDEMFRKTILSMKNMAKKNSYFDDVLSTEDYSNRYKIIGQIGKGGFSVVSSAYDKLTNRSVAVKIYDKLNTLGWHRLENIKKEIQGLQKLSHSNVVQVYHVSK